jgi:putative endonuclease
MYYVYVLKSVKGNRLYKGLTMNVDTRLNEHNAGRVTSTKGYRPWRLVFVESYSTLADARMREKQLKTGAGREFLKSLGLE